MQDIKNNVSSERVTACGQRILAVAEELGMSVMEVYLAAHGVCSMLKAESVVIREFDDQLHSRFDEMAKSVNLEMPVGDLGSNDH